MTPKQAVTKHGAVWKPRCRRKRTRGKPFFDFIAKKDGKLWTKFPTDENYISNQLKKSVQDVSLNGRIVGSNGGLTHSLPPTTDNNISLHSIVVNLDLPHFNTLYEGLTDFQAKSLKKAADAGFSKTNSKAGSLESMNKVKQELNEMISKAKITDRPSEVWQKFACYKRKYSRKSGCF